MDGASGMRYLTIALSSLILVLASATGVARTLLFALAFWATWLVPTDPGVSQSQDPLVIAVSRTYPPFTQTDINGEPAGMFVDIWNLWAQKTGRAVTFRSSDWVGTLAALKSGDADIHSGLYYSAKRDEWIER